MLFSATMSEPAVKTSPRDPTPMMAQYFQHKDAYPDALIFCTETVEHKVSSTVTLPLSSVSTNDKPSGLN